MGVGPDRGPIGARSGLDRGNWSCRLSPFPATAAAVGFFVWNLGRCSPVPPHARVGLPPVPATTAGIMAAAALCGAVLLLFGPYPAGHVRGLPDNPGNECFGPKVRYPMDYRADSVSHTSPDG